MLEFNVIDENYRLAIGIYYKGNYYVFNEVEGSRPRYKQIRNVEITNEDLAILEIPIDKVMFDLTLGADLVGIANSLVFPEVGSANAHELAEELIKKLELHLAEG